MGSTRSLGDQEGELLASFPADLASATEVSHYRSTWIVSSIDCVRSIGQYDRYRDALRRVDREHTPGAEEAIVSALANSWLPIQFAYAHYLALDRLGISEEAWFQAMLTAEGGHVRRTWHAQIIAAAQKPDAAAWGLLPQIPKWWPRSAQGGGMALYRLGPQEARVDYHKCMLLDLPLFLHSSRSVLSIFLSHFCPQLSASTLPHRKPGRASFVFRWG